MKLLTEYSPELKPHEAALLTAVSIDQVPGRCVTLAELLASWFAHVERFETELVSNTDDHSVWTDDDYLGALYIRSRLAEAIVALDLGTQGVAERLLAQADARFRAYTSHDEKRLLDRVVPGEPLGAGWWWHRIPISGPVLDTLRER